MSVDWSKVTPALISVFSTCAIDDDIARDAKWVPEIAGRPPKMVAPKIGFSLTLQISTIVGYGNDETRYTPVGGSSLARDICGFRKMTVVTKVECQENVDTKWAMNVIERIRTRLNLEEVTSILLAVNVSCIDIGASRDVSYASAGRSVSAATMPVVFTVAVNDTGAPPIGWIQSIGLKSQIGVPSDNTSIAIP